MYLRKHNQLNLAVQIFITLCISARFITNAQPIITKNYMEYIQYHQAQARKILCNVFDNFVSLSSNHENGLKTMDSPAIQFCPRNKYNKNQFLNNKFKPNAPYQHQPVSAVLPKRFVHPWRKSTLASKTTLTHPAQKFRVTTVAKYPNRKPSFPVDTKPRTTSTRTSSPMVTFPTHVSTAVPNSTIAHVSVNTTGYPTRKAPSEPENIAMQSSKPKPIVSTLKPTIIGATEPIVTHLMNKPSLTTMTAAQLMSTHPPQKPISTTETILESTIEHPINELTLITTTSSTPTSVSYSTHYLPTIESESSEIFLSSEEYSANTSRTEDSKCKVIEGIKICTNQLIDDIYSSIDYD